MYQSWSYIIISSLLHESFRLKRLILIPQSNAWLAITKYFKIVDQDWNLWSCPLVTEWMGWQKWLRGKQVMPCLVIEKKNLFFKQMNFHCSTYLVLITLINLPFFRWTQTNCSPLYMRKEQISCHKFGLQDITKFNLYFNWSDVLLKVSTWSDISTITTSAHPSCSTIPSETANNKLF